MEDGAIAGVDIGGSAPGMRETEMLNPANMVVRIHAVLLTGGSTFGLSAAGGVQKYLHDRDIGVTASTGVVVSIPGHGHGARGVRIGLTRYFGVDTTLSVVATDIAFSREQMTKIAMMAQDGIARAVRPSHTMFGGDVVFALSTRARNDTVDVNIAGSIAARLVSEAIVRGVGISNGLPIPEDL